MPYLTPDSINPITILRLIEVSVEPRLLGAVDDALCGLSDPSIWEKDGTLTVEQVTDYFNLRCLDYLSVSMLGLILPYATAAPPPYALACDGSTYLRTAYPRLYAALDSAFIVDANHFRTPDLNSGRYPVGAGSAYAVGAQFGENTHTLTIPEIPSHNHTSPAHTHTDLGHTHTESAVIPSTVTAGELPVPIPTAVPTVGVTGVGNANLSSVAVTINGTGGGGAHENRPPSTALPFCIIFA